MQPLISVIVPIYNVEKYLEKCIQSIQKQTYTNLEIILIDDGSPDNCGLICDKYAKNDDRIIVIHKKNGGLSRARNDGLDKASGDIISFVDSDDYIEPNMYEVMMGYLEQYDLDIICCETKIVKNGRLKYKPRYSKNSFFKDEECLREILSGNLDNAVCNKIYKKHTTEGVRFPIDRRYEDVATTYKFISKACRIGYIRDGLYNYMKNSGGLIANSFNCRNRYECFQAYSEQLAFAENANLACVEACRKNAIETSLATLTAFYANNEPESSDRFKDVISFIAKNINKFNREQLKPKFKVLLWSYEHTSSLHKLYAWLSKLSKKV